VSELADVSSCGLSPSSCMLERVGGESSPSSSPVCGRFSPATLASTPVPACVSSGVPSTSSSRLTRDKIEMWLPGGRGAADETELWHPTARRAFDPEAVENSDRGATSDPLKLLKQRRASHGGPPGTPDERAVRASTSTASVRAPHVRYPFEERQRSQSAPQKRTIAVSNPDASDSIDDRLAGAVGQDRVVEGRRAVQSSSQIQSLPEVYTAGERGSSSRLVGIRPRRGSRLACGDATIAGSSLGIVGSHGGLEGSERPPVGRRGGTVRLGDKGLALDVVGRGAAAGHSADGPWDPASRATAAEEEGKARGVQGSKRGGWGSTESSSVTGAIIELRTEDLASLPPPGAVEPTVTRAIGVLRDGDREGDWASQFEAINTLRRLFAAQPAGAPDIAILSHLHSLNLQLIAFSDSLRSALAKNASMAFREMFVTLGKHMEADLDLIVPMLIKKSAETNGFIADEANRALMAMAASVSEGRVICALAACASHRNPQARAKAAIHLSRALESMGWRRVLQMKELDKVVQAFGALNSEGLSETRSATRHGLVSLIRESRGQCADVQERLERLLRRQLSEKDRRKLMDAVDASTAGTFPAALEDTSESPMTRRSSLRPSCASRHGTSAGTHRSHDEPMASEGTGAIDDQLSTIVGQLSSSDWISRKEGANRLLSLARAQPEVLSRSSRLLSLVDAFTPQLSFANPKVMLAALAALEGLAPLLRRTLVPSIPTIVQALSSSLASSNAQVRAAAHPCLDALVAAVEPTTLLQPVANSALYASNPKARCTMLDRLGAICVSLHPSKPGLVSKHGLSVAYTLVDENKPELKQATAAYVKVLHSLFGIGLFEHALKLSAATQQRLHDVVQDC